MSASIDSLIHGYLDETLTAEQQNELANWIKAGPENARRFAEAVLLHDRLRTELLVGAFIAEEQEAAHAKVQSCKDQSDQVRSGRRSNEIGEKSSEEPELPPLASSRPCVSPAPDETKTASDFGKRRTLVALSTTLCLFLVLGLIFWQPVSSPALAAAAELQRIIHASETALDRTYVVTALDDVDVDPESLPTGRGVKPSVDGALLHVRGPNQYVLVRHFPDGTEFITGSNGTTAWSVPPQGRVHVSSDPTRFRGAVPGQQHAIPFIDMRNSLRQLQESYDLDLSPETTPEGWRRMDAIRKASATGGPKQVSIWYDATSGAVHRMLLERLPKGRGGPNSVLLELTDQSRLPDDFFSHESHHASGRRIDHEP